MLTLSDHTHVQGEIVSAVLDAARDSDRRAFVFTPADPLPTRRLSYPDPDTVVWAQDGPTFAKVKRVSNWGWLRKIANGYGEPGLLHPAIGTAFTVRTWRYRSDSRPGNRRRTGGIIPHERFFELPGYIGCVFIAHLSDGRIFADAWADRSVLYDALSRWRNAQGYTVNWQEMGMHDPPTCAIGGLDWKVIPERIAEHRALIVRERTREDVAA